jgi:hypothetical protein
MVVTLLLIVMTDSSRVLPSGTAADHAATQGHSGL